MAIGKGRMTVEREVRAGRPSGLHSETKEILNTLKGWSGTGEYKALDGCSNTITRLGN